MVANIPQQLENENQMKSIYLFYFNLKARMKEALNGCCTRFAVHQQPVPVAEPDSILSRMVPGLVRHTGSNVGAEIDLWLAQLPIELATGKTVASFWSEDSSAKSFPILSRLARAVLPTQASSAASERVWSSADDLCGGDRSNIDPEALNCALCLRKNTSVIAQMKGIGLFDALTAGKQKKKKKKKKKSYSVRVRASKNLQVYQDGPQNLKYFRFPFQGLFWTLP
jgi:hypothetical protein